MTDDITIFTDGGARGNPGPAAIGVVISVPAHTVSLFADDASQMFHREGDRVVFEISQTIGIATNNMAEYLAVCAAYDWLRANLQFLQGVSAVHFFLDSQLVVQQLNGVFKVKDSKMREYLLRIREYETDISPKIIYSLVPRAENSHADRLVNKAFDAS